MKRSHRAWILLLAVGCGLAFVSGANADSPGNILVVMPSGTLTATPGSTIHVPVQLDFSSAATVTDLDGLLGAELQLSSNSIPIMTLTNSSGSFVALDPSFLSGEGVSGLGLGSPNPSNGLFDVQWATPGFFTLTGLGLQTMVDLTLTIPSNATGSEVLTVDGKYPGFINGDISSVDLTPASETVVIVVPEPTSIGLCLAAAMLGLALASFRRLPVLRSCRQAFLLAKWRFGGLRAVTNNSLAAAEMSARLPRGVAARRSVRLSRYAWAPDELGERSGRKAA